MRRYVFVLTCLGLLIGATLLRAESEPLFESKSYGFSVTLASDSWVALEDPNRDSTLLTVTFSHAAEPVRVLEISVAEKTDMLSVGALRNYAESTLKQNDSVTNVEAGTTTVAGEDLPYTQYHVEDGKGRTFVERLVYVGQENYIYLLKMTVRKDEGVAYTDLMTSMAEAFAFIEIEKSESDKQRELWQILAARCGSQVNWAKDWAEASARATEEKKLVLLVVETHAMQAVPAAAPSGPFMDPDFIALVEEHFVPLRQNKGETGPWDPAKYGMGPTIWGQAVLFAKPDGTVLEETFSLETFSLYEMATDVIEKHRPSDRETEGPSEVGGERRTSNAERRTPNEMATAFRLRRKGDEALRVIAEALGEAADEERIELELDRAMIWMRQRKYLASGRIFYDLTLNHPKHRRVPEAMFWLDVCRAKATPEAEGVGLYWYALTTQFPENPWAWKAAANLLGTGAISTGRERVDWPEEELIEVAVGLKEDPPDRELDERISKAIEFLLNTQREDGSWITPSELNYSNILTEATTALAAQALLVSMERWGDGARERGDKAIAKALTYLMRDETLTKLRGKDLGAGSVSFDNSVWGQAYVLQFFLYCLDAEVGEKEELRTAAQRLIEMIVNKQVPEGGWAYSGTAVKLGKGDPSSSFQTAATVDILLEARDLGFVVPKTVFDGARKSLENMRVRAGVFEYAAWSPKMADKWLADDANLGGWAGRGPTCEWALRGLEGGTVEDLMTSLDLFLMHRVELISEEGKSLCHTGQQGQGSHYLMFDYDYAMRATARIADEKRQAEVRAELLDDLCQMGRADGSYVDNPTLGKPYGTAMFLLIVEAMKGR